MQIVVNHLTRMSSGYMCVAGIDLATAEHVRPVGHGRLGIQWLRRYGGPFDLGQIVDLGRVVHTGKAPEIEDHRFEPKQARRHRLAAADEFWRWLSRSAKPRISEIFGPELTRTNGLSYSMALGAGHASLGCLQVTRPPDLYLKRRPGRTDQVRMRLSDGLIEVDTSVTDIRFYDESDGSPDQQLVADIAAWLRRSAAVIVSLGLSRPFSPDPDVPPVHWLQVNNIHLAEVPLWQSRWEE